MIPSSAGVPKNKWHTTCLGVLTEPWLLLNSILVPCKAYKDAVQSLVDDDVGCLDSIFGGSCFFCGFDLRSRFRETLNLEGNSGEDFCLHLFCHCCALAQIKREARHWTGTIPKKPPPRRNQGLPHESFPGFSEMTPNQSQQMSHQRPIEHPPSTHPSPPRHPPMGQSLPTGPVPLGHGSPMGHPPMGYVSPPGQAPMGCVSPPGQAPMGRPPPMPSPYAGNVAVVTFVPRVSEMSRNENTTTHRTEHQNQRGTTSCETLTEGDLNGLDELDSASLDEILPQTEGGGSNGRPDRVVNITRLAELRRYVTKALISFTTVYALWPNRKDA